MKKIYLFLSISFLSAALLAQNKTGPSLSDPGLRFPTPPQKIYNKTNAISPSFWIDYTYSDSTYYPADGNTYGVGPASYFAVRVQRDLAPNGILPFMHNKSLVVGFNALHAAGADTIIPYSLVDSITVDSVSITALHTHLSGTNDTTIVSLVELQQYSYPADPAQGWPNAYDVWYPSTNVLWSDTAVADTVGYPAGAPFREIRKAPGVNIGTKRFGVRVEFWGSLQDTLFVGCGAILDPAGPSSNCLLGLNNITGAMRSPYYPSSYFEVQGKTTYYPNQVADTSWYAAGLDCDLSGGYTADAPPAFRSTEELLVQACMMSTKVTVAYHPLGIKEAKDLDRYTSFYPNPTNGQLTFQYTNQHPETLRFSIYDLQGKLILNNVFKASGAFQQTFDLSRLSKGMYLVRVQADSAVVTKKLSIVE